MKRNYFRIAVAWCAMAVLGTAAYAQLDPIADQAQWPQVPMPVGTATWRGDAIMKDANTIAIAYGDVVGNLYYAELDILSNVINTDILCNPGADPVNCGLIASFGPGWFEDIAIAVKPDGTACIAASIYSISPDVSKIVYVEQLGGGWAAGEVLSKSAPQFTTPFFSGVSLDFSQELINGLLTVHPVLVYSCSVHNSTATTQTLFVEAREILTASPLTTSILNQGVPIATVTQAPMAHSGGRPPIPLGAAVRRRDVNNNILSIAWGNLTLADGFQYRELSLTTDTIVASTSHAGLLSDLIITPNLNDTADETLIAFTSTELIGGVPYGGIKVMKRTGTTWGTPDPVVRNAVSTNGKSYKEPRFAFYRETNVGGVTATNYLVVGFNTRIGWEDTGEEERSDMAIKILSTNTADNTKSNTGADGWELLTKAALPQPDIYLNEPDNHIEVGQTLTDMAPIVGPLGYALALSEGDAGAASSCTMQYRAQIELDVLDENGLALPLEDVNILAIMNGTANTFNAWPDFAEKSIAESRHILAGLPQGSKSDPMEYTIRVSSSGFKAESFQAAVTPTSFIEREVVMESGSCALGPGRGDSWYEQPFLAALLPVLLAAVAMAIRSLAVRINKKSMAS
ncbi:MAG: hypothetical protein HYV27_12675 [Candidatus Hydrogenedentes bacterium]|nr:hypothetical protein [Candidatus Hydrogenedentota bacterium]